MSPTDIGSNWLVTVVSGAAGGGLTLIGSYLVRLLQVRRRTRAFKAQTAALIEVASETVSGDREPDSNLLASLVDRLNPLVFGPDASLALSDALQKDACALPMELDAVRKIAERADRIRRQIYYYKHREREEMTAAEYDILKRRMAAVPKIEIQLKAAKKRSMTLSARVLQGLR